MIRASPAGVVNVAVASQGFLMSQGRIACNVLRQYCDSWRPSLPSCLPRVADPLVADDLVGLFSVGFWRRYISLIMSHYVGLGTSVALQSGFCAILCRCCEKFEAVLIRYDF